MPMRWALEPGHLACSRPLADYFILHCEVLVGARGSTERPCTALYGFLPKLKCMIECENEENLRCMGEYEQCVASTSRGTRCPVWGPVIDGLCPVHAAHSSQSSHLPPFRSSSSHRRALVPHTSRTLDASEVVASPVWREDAVRKTLREPYQLRTSSVQHANDSQERPAMMEENLSIAAAERAREAAGGNAVVEAIHY